MPVRRRVVVRGRVQGVFFRESVRRLAESRAVRGWIRNTDDGAVEAIFEGDSVAVDALVAFCRQGPRGALVESVDVSEEPHEGIETFTVR